MPIEVLRSLKTNLRVSKETLQKVKTLSHYLPFEKELVNELEDVGLVLSQAQQKLINTNTIGNLMSFVIATRQIRMMAVDLLLECKNRIKSVA